MRAWIGVVLAWLCLAAPALAENRLALVIGNDDYQHIGKLLKAKADAKSYAGLLREKGFSVEDRYDLGFNDMEAAVGEFVEKIQPGDTAVFVYSGHGWSDGAHNYLLGVDAPTRVSQDILTQLSLPIRNGANGVFDVFERKGAGLKVAIIDACRDNPFLPPQGRKSYGLARGLRPEGIEGSFVIYSAGEGQSAMDRLSVADTDPNSVFTREFLPLLRADLPLLDAIKIAQDRVYTRARSADHDQMPAYYDEVRGRACLSRECRSPQPAASPASTDTGKKVALVIGNSKYVSLGELPNPANDAHSISDALTKIGFKVTMKEDVTREEFKTLLKEFWQESSTADTALFYFAGHGVQLSGKNYFIPADIKVENTGDIEWDSISMDDVVRATSRARKTRIIILDACRDSGASNKSRTASRSLTDVTATPGFAPFESINNAEGLIIFYSAQPGKEADDGEGKKNSPFAESLAKHLVERNTKIVDTFGLVMADVAASTNNSQQPVYSAAAPNVVLYPIETAEEAWQAIKKSRNPADFREFIRQYPDSPLADFAQTKLDDFDKDRRLKESEKALKDSEDKIAAAEEEKAAAIKRAEDARAAEQARIDRERAEKEQAEKEDAERKKKMEEDRQAAEQKAAEDKRKAEAAAAEQARIAKEKADLDAEAKRLADEAAALEQKQAEAEEAERKEELRRAAEEKDRKAKEAAEAAQKLEAEKQRAKLEEEARQEQAAREDAERQKKMEEDRQAAEQKAVEDKRKAEAAVAEQARIAKEKADKDAETKRLADEAAALAQKQAEEADAQRKEELRRQAEENDRKAKEAAEAAQKLEAEKQRAKLEEEARQEQAAREEAERKEKMEADRQAAEQKAAEDKRKADAAAAEQARIAKEKADKDAETKRLADEAAALEQKQAEAEEAQRKEKLRREAEEKDRKAKEAAAAAQKLEQARIEEEARKKQEDEAKAKRIAEACTHDQAELAQLAEAGKRDAIEILAAESLCPALPAAGYQAVHDIALREAKLCADDQTAFARIDQKDVSKLKAARETLKCESVLRSASVQIAKLETELAHQEQVCADERVKFTAIDLFAPPAMDQLAALAAKAECTPLRADISKTSDDIKTRVTDAQSELQRLGCYSPANPSGRFDDATIAALKKYLAARKASADPLKITEALVDELEDQDVKFCTPQPVPPPPVVAKPPGLPKPPAVMASRPPPGRPQWEPAPPSSPPHPQRVLETPPPHPQREFAPREFAPPSIRKHKAPEYDAPPREREALHSRPEYQPPPQPQRPYSAPSQGMSPPMGTMN